MHDHRLVQRTTHHPIACPQLHEQRRPQLTPPSVMEASAKSVAALLAERERLGDRAVRPVLAT